MSAKKKKKVNAGENEYKQSERISDTVAPTSPPRPIIIKIGHAAFALAYCSLAILIVLLAGL